MKWIIILLFSITAKAQYSYTIKDTVFHNYYLCRSTPSPVFKILQNGNGGFALKVITNIPFHYLETNREKGKWVGMILSDRDRGVNFKDYVVVVVGLGHERIFGTYEEAQWVQNELLKEWRMVHDLERKQIIKDSLDHTYKDYIKPKS